MTETMTEMRKKLLRTCWQRRNEGRAEGAAEKRKVVFIDRGSSEHKQRREPSCGRDWS